MEKEQMKVFYEFFGDPYMIEKDVNRWLKENAGRIEIVKRLMNMTKNDSLVIAIFYKVK